MVRWRYARLFPMRHKLEENFDKDTEIKRPCEEKSKQEILNGYTLIINYWLENVNKNINIQDAKIPNLKVDILAINSIN